MPGPTGEHGAGVDRPLTLNGVDYKPGDTISPEAMLATPLANRLAMVEGGWIRFHDPVPGDDVPGEQLQHLIARIDNLTGRVKKLEAATGVEAPAANKATPKAPVRRGKAASKARASAVQKKRPARTASKSKVKGK